MGDALLSCPGCQSGMKTLALDEAEVDYCTFCGGAWFDPGEVAAVVGHPLETTPSGRETLRKCARCQTQMVGASLGVVAVETCASCHGIYLDADEIDAVAERALGLGVRAVQTTKALTSTCVGCRDTFRLGELMATGKGLACPRCYTGLQYGGGTIMAPSSQGGSAGNVGFGDVSGGPSASGADGLATVAAGILSILGL